MATDSKATAKWHVTLINAPTVTVEADSFVFDENDRAYYFTNGGNGVTAVVSAAHVVTIVCEEQA